MENARADQDYHPMRNVLAAAIAIDFKVESHDVAREVADRYVKIVSGPVPQAMTDTPDLVREAFEALSFAKNYLERVDAFQAAHERDYKSEETSRLYDEQCSAEEIAEESLEAICRALVACDAQHRAALAEMKAAGTEAMRRAVCAWLRVNANALKKLGKDNSLLVEVHNAVLKMDASLNPGATHAG